MAKKNIIALSIALVVMIIIGVMLALLLSGKQAEYENESQKNDLITVNEIDSKDVVMITFSWSDTEDRTFIIEGDKWYLEDDNQSSVDQTSIRSALNFLSYMYAQNIAAEDITKLDKADYQLDEPSMSVELEMADGNTVKYDFGCLTSAKDGIYFVSSTDNRLYTFSLENYDYIVKGANAISDLTINIDAENLVSIEFLKPTGERTPVKMDKVDGTELWELSSPYTAYADDYFISQLVGMFNPCSFHRQIADKDDSSYGFSDNSGYIYVKDASGNEAKLIFGNISDEQNDRYYCMLDGNEAVYETFGGWSNVLGIDMQNVLKTNPFDMTSAEFDEVKFGFGADEYVLECSNSSYALNGRQISGEEAQSISTALSSIAKRGIADNSKNTGEKIGEITFLKNGQKIASYSIYEYMKEYAALCAGDGDMLSSYIDVGDLEALKSVLNGL